jgi:precorrin-2/cobalt-factor-2 C20-methyltransferase
MKGILYGVGVGPGDPELLTLKAARLIKDCDVIAVPHKEKDRCFALRIAAGAIPEIDGKPVVEIDMPMTRNAAVREQAYEAGALKLKAELDAGKTVVFLTLGDPTVYSTYGYLHERVAALGYDARLVPGVTSFCASAAALGIPLCEDSEELHVIPGGRKDPGAVLSYGGTKVFMKGNVPELLDAAEKDGTMLRGAENCGTENEKLYRKTADIPGDAGYYTVSIAKENEK